jgi:MoxR-like ATPase
MNEYDDNPYPTPPPAAEPARGAAPTHSAPSLRSPRQELSDVVDIAHRMRHEIGKAVVGQRGAIEHLLTAFLASGHVLLEGVPGLGKTLSVLALSRTFGGHFSRIQFTPDLMPADVTGHSIFDSASNKFRLKRGPAFTNLLLADEINRAPAKTQAALLEVMQEQQISIDGQTFKLPPPFMTVATQNPIEQEGTYPLPEAQLDRFLLKVVIDYPEQDEEIHLVERVTTGRKGDSLDVSSVEQVTTPELVTELQQKVASLVLDKRVVEYAVNIVRSCRDSRSLRIGPGPRGGIALVRSARALAVLRGRDYVLPDDIKDIAPACLMHRIQLSPELEIEGVRADQEVRKILDAVEAPRL